MPQILPVTTLTISLAIFSVGTAGAQSGMPADIAERIAGIGRVINPPATAQIYVPLHEKEPYAGVKVTRDVKYGSDDRNALDIFQAEGATGSRPVLIFVHGGGFTAGSKRAPNSPFYDNVPLWAARNGMVGVNMTYRLAPVSKWPSGAQDVGSAVQWVASNIATYGGDPSKVFVWGHSAGATHVGSYVANPQFYGPKGSGLAEAILMSGIYDLNTFPLEPNYKTYFGEDAALYAERSPLHGVVKSKVPLLVLMGEMDPPAFEQQYKQIVDALCKGSACPRSFVAPKHSHISLGFAINTKDASVTGQVANFIKAGK